MPDKHTFRLEMDNPAKALVELDGQNIANLVSGATITCKVGDIPRVELDLVIFETGLKTGEADIYLPQETKDLLVKFGWTPPVEEAK